MSVPRGCACLAAFGVAALTAARAARAGSPPRFGVVDDDAAWIAGALPGAEAIDRARDEGEDFYVRASHEGRRAIAWMAIFRSVLRPSVDAPPSRAPLHLFDFTAFANDIREGRSSPSALPRDGLRDEVRF